MHQNKQYNHKVLPNCQVASSGFSLPPSFCAYLHDRISGACAISPLAELVSQAANELGLGQPCPTPSF
jgi:hypothetical protein